MADDVWAGIPVELREKVEAAMIAYAGAQVRGRCRSGLCVDDEDATDADFLALESHLCAALRSLVSRLQESEKDVALGKLLRQHAFVVRDDGFQDEIVWGIGVRSHGDDYDLVTGEWYPGPVPETLDEAVERVGRG